jgi:putative DNA primase/helicase
VDRWPDTDAKRTANDVFGRLDNLNPAEIGAEQDTDQDGHADGIPYLRFDSAALELFIEWRTDLETRLRSGDLHPALESHLAKHRKLIPGLALICHLADGGTGPVTESATLRALAWGGVSGGPCKARLRQWHATQHRNRQGDPCPNPQGRPRKRVSWVEHMA